MAKKHHDKLLEAIESSDKHLKAIEATRDMALITKELTEKVKKAQEKWPLKNFSKDILNQLQPKAFDPNRHDDDQKKEIIDFFNKLKDTKGNLKKILKNHIEHRPDDDQKKEMIEFFDLIVDQEPRILKNIKNVLDLPLIDEKSKENIEYFNLFLQQYNFRLHILINHYKDYSKDLYENKKTMTQIEKLNNLIKKVLKEELEEVDKMVVQKNDPKKAPKMKAAQAAGVTVVEDDPTDPSSDKLKLPETEMDSTETPLSHDLAGKIAEVIDGLKAITESPKDKKHGKYAEKVMKHIGAAQAALEALTGHESILEEKDAAQAEKDAEGHLKGIRKHMSKVIKDKDTLDRIMNKMPVGKAMELKKAAGGELDEEKVAKAMLKYVIKEGLVK
jgi:hypothetical protein